MQAATGWPRRVDEGRGRGFLASGRGRPGRGLGSRVQPAPVRRRVCADRLPATRGLRQRSGDCGRHL